MLKTVVIAIALACGLQASSIPVCLDVPTSNSGFPVTVVSPSEVGCGPKVMVPDLDPTWTTGLFYTFDVLSTTNLINGVFKVEAQNGVALQAQSAFWLKELGLGSERQSFTLDGSQFKLGLNDAEVFFKGIGAVDLGLVLNYGPDPADAPEPGYMWGCGGIGVALVLVSRRLKTALV